MEMNEIDRNFLLSAGFAPKEGNPGMFVREHALAGNPGRKSVLQLNAYVVPEGVAVTVFQNVRRDDGSLSRWWLFEGYATTAEKIVRDVGERLLKAHGVAEDGKPAGA